MNQGEKRAVFSLGSIFLLRMLGLFLLLPVLAIHVQQFEDATPFYVGLALGIYGLTQAIFQIPYGMASDRLGRKRVIAFGLLVFMLGSVIAALSDSLFWLIVGRALQGAGAISSAVLALTADLTREEQRTKSMAIIGVSIGFAFLLSLILAPVLQHMVGVNGIFWMIAILSVVAVIVLYLVVPTPARSLLHRDILPLPKQFASVLANKQLLRLNFGIFCLHLILTALFVVTPMILITQGGVGLADHWKLYLPVLLLSAVGMLPFIRLGSKPGYEIQVFRYAILLLLVGLSGLAIAIHNSLWFILAFLVIFFSGFNALESILPSLVSRVAPVSVKGTAMGLYNCCQFFGMFVGGVSAGWLYGQYGSSSVYVFCGGVAFIWLIMAITSGDIRLFSSKIISIADCPDSRRTQLVDRIGRLKGIKEMVVTAGEATAYLTVDPQVFDENELNSELEQFKRT